MSAGLLFCIFCRNDAQTQRVHASSNPANEPRRSQSACSRSPSPDAAGADSSKRFRCDVCGYCTDRCSHYTRHLKTHTDSKPYDCLDCGRRFKLETYLKKHRCASRAALAQRSAHTSCSTSYASPFETTHLMTVQNDCLRNCDVDLGHAECAAWSVPFADSNIAVCSGLLETL